VAACSGAQGLVTLEQRGERLALGLPPTTPKPAHIWQSAGRGVVVRFAGRVMEP